MLNRVTHVILEICRWVVLLVYLNILWILFSLLGGLFLGIGPATYALYQTIKYIYYQEAHHQYFSLFWYFFKNKFIKSQLVILVLVAFFGLFGVNIYLLSKLEAQHIFIVVSFLIGLFIICLLPALFLYPVMSFFDEELFEYIRISVYISFTHIRYSLLLLIGIVLIIFASLLIPMLFILLFMSVISLWSTWVSSYLLPNYIEKNIGGESV